MFGKKNPRKVLENNNKILMRQNSELKADCKKYQEENIKLKMINKDLGDEFEICKRELTNLKRKYTKLLNETKKEKKDE